MPAAAAIYQLAHSEAAHLRAMLEDVAERFNATFALTADEVDALEVRPELHAAGAAIELTFPGQDSGEQITFSLLPLEQRGTSRTSWELAAYHGDRTTPEQVSTLMLPPTREDRVRRMRGARLIAAIGDYLEEQRAERETEESMVAVMTQLRSETTHAAWLPQIAASYRVYHA